MQLGHRNIQYYKTQQLDYTHAEIQCADNGANRSYGDSQYQAH